MKNLQNLKGTQLLSKKEQQNINGGAEGSAMKCADGTEFDNASSCSDWAIEHYCGSHGGLDICVGGGGIQ